MTECVFCKIVKKEIPSRIMYETDKIVAFLTIRPTNDGHALVVHKHHHSDIFDTPEEDMKELIVGAQKVAKAIHLATECEGINIGMNNKPAAGQEIFHAHLHVIPRFAEDGLRHWPGKEATPDELKEMQKKITKAIQ